MSNAEVLPFLKTGDRMSAPVGCPPAVHQLMLQCWAEKAKERPDFVFLRQELIRLSGRNEYYYEETLDGFGTKMRSSSVYLQPLSTTAGDVAWDVEAGQSSHGGYYDNQSALAMRPPPLAEAENEDGGTGLPGSVVYDIGAAETPVNGRGAQTVSRVDDDDNDDEDVVHNGAAMYDLGKAREEPQQAYDLATPANMAGSADSSKDPSLLRDNAGTGGYLQVGSEEITGF